MSTPLTGAALRRFLILDGGPGTTPVTNDLVNSYLILAEVTKDLSNTYSIGGVIELAMSASFRVLEEVSADLVNEYLIGSGGGPKVDEVLQRLGGEALVEFFEIDISPITGTDTSSDHFYFHSGTNELNASVVWQGKTYNPFPIQGEGYDLQTRGALPRPRLRVSNVTSIITALLLQVDDLVGAKVIRRRTFVRYLDAVNFAAGNAFADPNQHLEDDVFYVERKVTSNRSLVEWELSSALDLEGQQLPNRVISIDVCPWKYRGGECGYTGSNYFDTADRPVATAGEDVCSKKITGCKKRFGARAPLPFGGFPGARAYRY